jgi:hypothetical protein
MKLNIFKTNIISFISKTNSIHFDYFVGDLLIVRSDCIQDLGAMLDNKLHFHRHVACLHSQALKLLELIRFITYNFSSLDNLNCTLLSPLMAFFQPILINWKICKKKFQIYVIDFLV